MVTEAAVVEEAGVHRLEVRGKVFFIVDALRDVALHDLGAVTSVRLQVTVHPLEHVGAI